MRLISCAVAVASLLLPVTSDAKPFEEMFPSLVGNIPEDIETELRRIDYKQGQIELGNNIATIDTGTDYYFLDPEDAKFVLEEVWKNPPGIDNLGMVFPAIYVPHDGHSWGVELQFDDIGYVSDEDAEGYDYDSLLTTLKDDTAQESKWRQDNGYDSIELVGWAAPPAYNRQERALHWAKELKIGDYETNTLNYNLRMLGRRGVLVANFIATMPSFEEVDAATPQFASMINFTDGHRYADFDPSIDKVAAVGIGGLIAGKVLAKTGLIVVLLAFLKKFWILALLPLFALKRLFSGRSNGSDGPQT